ncbi:hypothetical protein HII28_19640 [Planctomonas sp. JC2975]|uniref:hypothetical protein n=1 Tax=Planctomonas sp. JC2975 TaxID=2729626 RepID=UPI001472D70C|nr:hypothetical protein [Planctomonas sp. JC2975]NNC14077.1 hypothetical protein [Planctomonas sp. JC2975]
MQLTERDEAMLDWLSVVRLADMDALRWALAGLSDEAEPVSLRRAQQWTARLAEVGLVDRARPTFRDGSIVWATHQAIGKSAPNLFRQTTRHEVAVAAVSARYLARGYTWERDRKPAMRNDHQADGVAVSGDGKRELVEVELTPKTNDRYRVIFENHVWRLAREGVERVVYFCDAPTSRIVGREADVRVFRDERHRIVIAAAFDVRGKWVGDEGAAWRGSASPAPTPLPELAGEWGQA